MAVCCAVLCCAVLCCTVLVMYSHKLPARRSPPSSRRVFPPRARDPLGATPSPPPCRTTRRSRHRGPRVARSASLAFTSLFGTARHRARVAGAASRLLLRCEVRVRPDRVRVAADGVRRLHLLGRGRSLDRGEDQIDSGHETEWNGIMERNANSNLVALAIEDKRSRQRRSGAAAARCRRPRSFGFRFPRPSRAAVRSPAPAHPGGAVWWWRRASIVGHRFCVRPVRRTPQSWGGRPLRQGTTDHTHVCANNAARLKIEMEYAMAADRRPTCSSKQ